MKPDFPIINSVLDQDLYKFSMQSAILKLYDDLDFRATFTNRGKTPFPDGFGEALREQVNMMADLALTQNEEKWLRECPSLTWLPRSYIDFLKGYRYDPSEVTITQAGSDLAVTVEGPWYSAIMWEVPLLATISELYFITTDQKPDYDLLRSNLAAKTEKFRAAGCKVTDFGTRRRASYGTQKSVIEEIVNNEWQDVYVGTSNMHFAHIFNTRPIGTHAHEWFMAHEALFGPRYANRKALEAWMDVFKGRLGTALTDTYTTDVFLRDFDYLMARRFEGVRQDSGCCVDWGEKIIAHYQKLGIDPTTKTAIFSDNLDADKTVNLQKTFGGRIGIAFGIGTNLTNDCGLKPLNMVIKASAFKVHDRWVPVVKLSDTPGKHSGSAKDVALVQGALGIEEEPKSQTPGEKRDTRYAAMSDAELLADFAKYDAFVKAAYANSPREREIVLKTNSHTNTWREILRRGLMKEEDYKCL